MSSRHCVPRFYASIIVAAISVLCIRTAIAEDPLPSVERLRTSPVLRHLKPNPMPRAPRTPAERTVAQMYVPEGFRAELIAAEPQLHQPIAFAWDERGRLWVAEANSYPTKRPAGKGLDNIVIFEDRDGDGIFETRKVFAEGLNLVSALEVGYGGVWIGAAPQLLFIPDRNHDDVPDGPPEVLLDGFGFQDTHECLNSFMWGPDGWLYGNQGVFNLAHIGKPGAPAEQRTELRAGVWRYHPVRHEFEVFAHGGSNPWGLDYDEHGQIFMTHCRSYWGRGLTTHVIQGGHYWNQANANHAPFIIANPPADFPEFRNYLLASARYDHGAGGAGKPGSDAIYGGHSHVGTMIYLGDNWPDEFRGHLFTHNLGGHQMNQQINRPLGSGSDTVHAGKDMLFCSDPKYVAIDLQYGPDGAVYIIDWYDQQHCHNPNTEQWDRRNGRIYRLEWAATYKPVKVDLAAKTDLELVELLSHKNEWFVRTAQRLLNERAAAKQPLDEKAKARVRAMGMDDPNPLQRLRGLWTGHAIGTLTDEVVARALADTDEYVRAWAVQLRARKRIT
jgi:putative membrane-bound dehydrogenase-like protein